MKKLIFCLLLGVAFFLAPQASFCGVNGDPILLPLPTASVTVSGVSELATNAEVAAGTDSSRIVTPSSLASVYQYGTIYVDAAAMIPCTTNGALQGTYEYGTNDIDIDYFAFDAGAIEELVQFKLKMPENWDRGTVKVKYDWSSATGSTVADTVEWGIKAGALSDSDVIDAALGTSQVISDALLADNGVDWQITSATPAITIGGTSVLGDIVLFKVYRNTDGTDNMAEDAWLFSLIIQYKKANTVTIW